MAWRCYGAVALPAGAALASFALGASSTSSGCFWSKPKSDVHSGPVTVKSVLLSARSICAQAHIPIVATRADDGVDCRVMDAHGPFGDEMKFSLVSRDFTRKAKQLAADQRCTLAFHDPRSRGETGYLSLKGEVAVVDDPAEARRYWKDSWTIYHAGPECVSDTVVYLFTPARVEVVDNDRWLRGDWAPVAIRRDGAEGAWAVAPAETRADRRKRVAAAG